MKRKYYYLAGAERGFGEYGVTCPVNRERAKRLLKYISHRQDGPRFRGLRRYVLHVVPKEGQYASQHGASLGVLIMGLTDD